MPVSQGEQNGKEKKLQLRGQGESLIGTIIQ